MAEIKDFTRQFTQEKLFDPALVMRIGREFYLVPQALRQVMAKTQRRPAFAGTLIAAERGDGLRPSTQLLDMIAKTDAKSVTINEKAEWLVICGRPPLLSSIVGKKGDPQRGDTVLILNMKEECIGYGVVKDEWFVKKGIVRLEYDIGDFLRRERRVMQRPTKQRLRRS
jgi:ribosome biogenesis protein Nip4